MFFAAGSPSRPAGGWRERLVEVKIPEAIVQLLEGGDHGEGVALGSSDRESAQVPSDVLAHLAQRAPLVTLVDDAPGGVALDDGDNLGEAGAERDGPAVVGGDDVAEDPGASLGTASDADAVAAGALQHRQGIGGLEDVAVAEDGGCRARSFRRAISSQWARPA